MCKDFFFFLVRCEYASDSTFVAGGGVQLWSCFPSCGFDWATSKTALTTKSPCWQNIRNLWLPRFHLPSESFSIDLTHYLPVPLWALSVTESLSRVL